MVKYFIILFFSFFVQIKTEAQIYVPFPDSNAVWQVEYGGYQCSCCASYNYSFTGDTLISAIVYHKLQQRGLKYLEIQGLCSTIPMWSLDEYIGAIRSDNIQKKVFIVPRDSSSEFLLYDFNMNVGDTVQGWLNYHSFSSPGIHVVVDSIDSLLISNQYRKRFNLLVIDGGFMPVEIIEGIGSTSEPFIGPLYEFEWNGYISCFMQDGQVLFPDTNSSCIFTELTEKLTTNSSLNVFPNPFSTELAISIHRQSKKPVNIEIINICGQKLFLEQFNSSIFPSSRKVDLSFLSSGIYMLVVTIDEERMVQRIVKE